ncbi:sulfite exporter TauE/SafE family protein [Caldichromatium japonicum]|uniref:Probable membrane transporter protein n=1 Tax=Caldichromatium japonicum TaxID=2699430 RepID=A0A6G7VBQ3_9GAMM|nr:sulfite exporter TauE/SafE family protein [Caldichromatium japonicum]QIK37489.1 sulfite exporter TauE/SafE family protein [Caldichromatium japonicum]
MTAFIAYLAIGALAGLLAGLFGIGGGAVMVPALFLFWELLGIGGDWTVHLAVGTSLATIMGTGLASTLAHQRRAGVRWDLVLLLSPGILIGALAGPALAGWVPGLWLKRLFAAFLTLVGLHLLHPRRQDTQPRPLPGRAVLIGAGGGIGMLSALVGIGGGTLTVPFLNRHGIEMRQAVGTSAACGVTIAIAGTIGFVLSGWDRADLPPDSLGFVHWPAVLAMLAASLPAATLGARLAHHLPVATLRRLFGVLLLLIAMRLALAG